MAHPNVETAVRARLVAGFTACQILEDGVFNPPANAAPFIALQFPFSRSSQATAGDPGANVYRETGGFRIVLVVPRRAEAIADGKQWCAEIADLFRGTAFDGVRTYAPDSPATDDGNDRQGSYVLAFAVPYDFDLMG